MDKTKNEDIVVCDFKKCTTGQGKCHISAHGVCTVNAKLNNNDMVDWGNYYFCKTHSTWIEQKGFQDYASSCASTMTGGYSTQNIKYDMRDAPKKKIQ